MRTRSTVSAPAHRPPSIRREGELDAKHVSRTRRLEEGDQVARYVIGADVAVRLARERAVVASAHHLLAPTLMRSQVLALLFRAVEVGELTKGDAEGHLDFVRGLRVRLLGDRVLQRVAWQVAEQLGWHDTLDAEYVALTKLQADALVTLDARLATEAGTLIAVAPFQALMGP
jgi:predicted nucleic acid-binding protein